MAHSSARNFSVQSFEFFDDVFEIHVIIPVRIRVN